VAVAVGATAVATFRRHGRDPWIARPALLALGLVVLQITLGGLTVWTRRAVLPTTLHLVVGASLLATMLTLALRAGRALGWRRPLHAAPAVGRRVYA